MWSVKLSRTYMHTYSECYKLIAHYNLNNNSVKPDTDNTMNRKKFARLKIIEYTQQFTHT